MAPDTPGKKNLYVALRYSSKYGLYRYQIWFKRVRIVRKKERPIVDDQIPIFTKDRSYLLQYMEIEES